MENEFIRWLRERLPSHPALKLGPGDDAAVLRLAQDADIVVTSDLLTDGVDFRLSECDPKRVGRKSLAVNLSDLASMAATPIAVVVSLALPRDNAAELARELYRGLLELAVRHDVALAGGDTNTWDGGLVISVTALGQVMDRGPLRRGGAGAGDKILVTGSFGGSILGKHFDFEPRVCEAQYLHQHYELHAGIDVSDGLALDLSRLATESQVGAEIEVARIPIDPAAVRLEAIDQVPALEHALNDGEDFELILATSPDTAAAILADQPLPVPVTCIGQLTQTPGLWQIATDNSRRPLVPRGYEHR